MLCIKNKHFIYGKRKKRSEFTCVCAHMCDHCGRSGTSILWSMGPTWPATQACEQSSGTQTHPFSYIFTEAVLCQNGRPETAQPKEPDTFIILYFPEKVCCPLCWVMTHRIRKFIRNCILRTFPFLKRCY